MILNTIPLDIGLNSYQIIYIVIVVGIFGYVYGRKILKDHRKKQKERNYWKHK